MWIHGTLCGGLCGCIRNGSESIGRGNRSGVRSPTNGFEMTSRGCTVITYVPVTTYFGRVRTVGNIQVGKISTIDRQAGHVPVVDVCAKVA